MIDHKAVSSTKILAAVQAVWELSGFAEPTTGIVPLYELIAAYPIWFAEIPRLTSRQARIFLAKKMGQTPLLELASDEPLSGFLFAQLSQSVFTGCILVDGNDILPRRRFSAAHELGHYLLHFLPAMQELVAGGEDEIMVAEGLVYGSESENEADIASEAWLSKQPVLPGIEIANNVMLFTEPYQETEANHFAAELLMPKSTCLSMVQRYYLPYGRQREYLANRLSSELLVSKEAIHWRLASLGI